MIVSIETDRSKIVIDDSYCTNDVAEEKKHREMLVAKAYAYIAQRDLMMVATKDGFVRPVSEKPEIALCGEEKRNEND